MTSRRSGLMMTLLGGLLLSVLAALVTALLLLATQNQTTPPPPTLIALLPSATPIQVESATPRPAPSHTAAAIASLTPSETATFAPTATPPTLSPTPTFTLTPLPTNPFSIDPFFLTPTLVLATDTPLPPPPTLPPPAAPTDALPPPPAAATDVPPQAIPPTAIAPPPTFTPRQDAGILPTPTLPPPPTATVGVTEVAVAAAPPPPPEGYGPTLTDYWQGRAQWVVDVASVGLPRGESDTVDRGGGVLWSYLHASARSRGIVDQCGAPVEFPGCVTLWASADYGRSFQITGGQCLMACQACPCDSGVDNIDQQQYPRIASAYDGTMYMVYEYGAQTVLRTSSNGGTVWSAAQPIPGTGIWPLWFRQCGTVDRIGTHPFVPDEPWDCLVGAPPGIYVEGDELYVFVALGSSPSHMGCLRGSRFRGAAGLRRCNTNPLFSGATTYGPVEANGAAANPYFDFRYVSSADVVQDGGYYYMAYSGVRGPGPGEPGDSQFALGFARSAALDAPWEKYPGNPVLFDLPGDIGLGHADLVRLDGAWYMYTTTSATVRGRYRLAWR